VDTGQIVVEMQPLMQHINVAVAVVGIQLMDGTAILFTEDWVHWVTTSVLYLKGYVAGAGAVDQTRSECPSTEAMAEERRQAKTPRQIAQAVAVAEEICHLRRDQGFLVVMEGLGLW